MSRKKSVIIAVALFVSLCICFMAYSFRVSQEAKRNYEYGGTEQSKRAFARNPDDPVALRSMATQCLSNNDTDGARKYLQRCVQVDPADKGSKLQLAHVFLLTRQKDKALPILESLAKDDDEYGQDAKVYLQKIHGAYTIH